jgi:hypothetical protein
MVQFKLIRIRKSNDEIRKKLEMRIAKSMDLIWSEGTQSSTARSGGSFDAPLTKTGSAELANASGTQSCPGGRLSAAFLGHRSSSNFEFVSNFVILYSNFNGTCTVGTFDASILFFIFVAAAA